jgi:hypothetical protein
MNHPRFGRTRCVRSLREIGKGEEIFSDYSYKITDEKAPRYI